jgi:hypothetical protein
MEHRWDATDRRKLRFSEKNLSQLQFVQQKSHMDWLEIETGTPGREAGN